MTWFTKTRVTASIAGVAAAGLLLAGCAGGNSADSNTAAENSKFVYITSDPIGQNEFLRSGKTGIDSVAEKHDGEAVTYESKDDATRRANLEQAVAEQPAVVVMLGFQFADLAKEFAEQYPEQKFLLIDTFVEGAPDNLYQATFREQEPSYLLGVEAALLTKQNSVGAVLSVDNDLLRKYSDGFAAGAKSVTADINALEPQIIGGENPFADTARAKEQAIAYVSTTATDQVFAVGAAANGGIMEAAAEKGFFAYGVDANQCGMAPGHVVDGTLKAVNKVVETVVGEILEGKSNTEATSSFGLAEGGMNVVSLADGADDSGCVVMEHPEVLKQVKEVAEKIKSGDIKVTEKSGS